MFKPVLHLIFPTICKVRELKFGKQMLTERERETERAKIQPNITESNILA